jgi:NAD(P)-dependent dehydrogenase (short-subunit alcohol dehydrogenase family)
VRDVDEGGTYDAAGYLRALKGAINMASSSSPRRLEGRVAIVTGASRGIGEGIAKAFAREGAAVVVAARTVEVWRASTPETIHDTVNAIRELGGTAIAVQCDVSKPDDLERLVATTRAELGPCDLLVNNAAITIPGRPPEPGAPAPAATKPTPAAPLASTPPTNRRLSFVDFPLYGYKSHFEVGLFAAYRLMQLVLPEMIERKRGAIINVSSSASEHPGEGPYTEYRGGHFAYGGNKAALQHLTQAVAYEMAQHGIVANALSPSLPVATPGNIWVGADLSRITTQDEFNEAAILLANETPPGITGRHCYNLDVIHPELGRRGWLG